MLVYGFIGDESKFIEIDGSLQSMQNFVGQCENFSVNSDLL